jgi:hypothetical protein
MFILIVACGISIVVIGLLFIMAAGLDAPVLQSGQSFGQTKVKACTVVDLDENRPRISHTSIRFPG